MSGAAHDEISLYEGLVTTRAIRRYGDDDIPAGDLNKMLFAATRGPSGHNTQPLRFLVLRRNAEAVAARVGLVEGDDWQIAWQSAGRTPEPWIGPDILEVIDALGDDGDVAGVIVSACGFVADHLEVLYDLDIEAAARAESQGLAFDRTACVNDDPAIMAALAERVRNLAP